MIDQWDLLWRLGLALVLASAIGYERELSQKNAGLKTHALVGLGAALFMVVSQYGFFDVLGRDVVLDPSRVAAQIVSGIGFIGAGLIFVRRDSVQGLTTAAGIWLTAAVGTAAGAGLEVVAVAATLGYFLVAEGIPKVLDRLPWESNGCSRLQIVYRDREGILRRVLTICSERGFGITDAAVSRQSGEAGGTVAVNLELRGRGSLPELVGALDNIDGMESVFRGDDFE